MMNDGDLRQAFGPFLVESAIWLSQLVQLPRKADELPGFIQAAPTVARPMLDVLRGVVRLAQTEWPGNHATSAADMAHLLDIGFRPAAIRSVDAALEKLDPADEAQLRLSIAQLHHWLGWWRLEITKATGRNDPRARAYASADLGHRHRTALTEAMAVLKPLVIANIPSAASLVLRIGRLIPVLDAEPDLAAGLDLAEKLVAWTEPGDPSARLIAQDILLRLIGQHTISPELVGRLTALLHAPSGPETEAWLCEGLSFAANIGAVAAAGGQDAAVAQIAAILDRWGPRHARDELHAFCMQTFGYALAGWLAEHAALPAMVAACRKALDATAAAPEGDGPALAATMLAHIVAALRRPQRPAVPVAVADMILERAAELLASGPDVADMLYGLTALATDLLAIGDKERGWRALEVLARLPDRTAYWTVGRFALRGAVREDQEAVLAAEAAAARPGSAAEALALVHLRQAMVPDGALPFLTAEEVSDMKPSDVRELDGRFATLCYETWLQNGRTRERAEQLAEQLLLVRGRSAGAEQPELAKLIQWANDVLPEDDSLRADLAALSPTDIDVRAILDGLQQPGRPSLLPAPVVGDWRWAGTNEAAHILMAFKTGWLLEQHQLGRTPYSIRVMAVPFIRQGRLAEIFLDENMSRSGVLLYTLEGGVLRGRLLTGESASLHVFFQQHALDFTTETLALAAAELFCNNIQSQEGCFRLILSEDQLPTADMTVGRFEPPVLTRDADGGWQIQALMLYAGALFRTRLKLAANGGVEMEDDDPIVDGVPAPVIRYDADRTRRLDG